jgi:methyl-accepting chemotaxis protein
MDNKRRSLRFWLITGSSLAVLLGVIGLTTARYLAQSQLEHYAERFLLLSSLRKEALESYFDTVRAEITFWSLNESLLDKQAQARRHLETYRTSRDKKAASVDYEFAMSALLSELRVLARLFVSVRGYYDFFLISREGDVFFTIKKETDLGTNLETGPWRETGLADVYRRALESGREGGVVFSDLEPYPPSNGEPAMFAARAMVDADGEMLGILALQLPTERIRSIMQFTAGMGESGETYVVGEDYLMRSDSRFSQDSTILRVEVDTESVKQAFEGNSGSLFTPDYRGVMVLSAYTATDIDGFRWAVLAEIDKDEVLKTVSSKRPVIAGLMFLLYTLALWSFWYIRGGEGGGSEPLPEMASDTDYPSE